MPIRLIGGRTNVLIIVFHVSNLSLSSNRFRERSVFTAQIRHFKEEFFNKFQILKIFRFLPEINNVILISLFIIFKMSYLQSLLNEYWLFYKLLKQRFNLTFHFQSQTFSEQPNLKFCPPNQWRTVACRKCRIATPFHKKKKQTRYFVTFNKTILTTSYEIF